MSEATAYSPADTAIVQSQGASLDMAGRQVMAGVVTETFQDYTQRTEGSYSDFFKDKVGGAIDKLSRVRPEIVGMTIFGSVARGEAQHQKEDGSSSDIDGTILIDIDKNPDLSQQVIRSDDLFMGVEKKPFDSLRMDMDYTMELSGSLDPAIRKLTDRQNQQSQESDDVEIRPISDQIIVEQIDAMCQTAKSRLDAMQKGEELPYFASRNIRALYETPISGDIAAYKEKADKAFAAMEVVYGKDVRDSAWGMLAESINKFHNGRQPNEVSAVPSSYDAYVSMLENNQKIIDRVPIGNVEAKQVGSAVTKELIDIVALDTATEKLDKFEPNWEGVFNYLSEHADIFKDPQARLDYMKKITPAGLMELLSSVHSFLAPEEVQSPSDKVLGVGRSVGNEFVSSQLFIDPNDRAIFIQQLATKLQGSENVEQAADLMGYGTVLMHAFDDGNGRTARFLQQLIYEGYDGSEQSKQDLKDSGEPRDNQGSIRTISFAVDPSIARSVVDDELTVDLQDGATERMLDVVGKTDTKYDEKFISNIMTMSNLDGIQDEKTKYELMKVMQQRHLVPQQ